MTIAGGLVEVRGVPVWTEGKNARSRRKIVVDTETARVLRSHRAGQLHERMLAGPGWEDHDLVVSSKTGTPVSPGNFDQTLERLVARAGVPRLTSHGLRHTAATHMVRQAADAGELRAVADVLGHSPDMLMKTYAHALPDSIKAVADRIAARAGQVPSLRSVRGGGTTRRRRGVRRCATPLTGSPRTRPRRSLRRCGTSPSSDWPRHGTFGARSTKCGRRPMARRSGCCSPTRGDGARSSRHWKGSRRRRSERRRGRSRSQKRASPTGGRELGHDLRLDISHVRCKHEGMARRPVLDDLDRHIAERAKANPDLPAAVEARVNRRKLQRQLAERRIALGMTQTEAAALMKTSQSSIARIESGEHDVRLGTLERYAKVLGCAIAMTLQEAS